MKPSVSDWQIALERRVNPKPIGDVTKHGWDVFLEMWVGKVVSYHRDLTVGNLNSNSKTLILKDSTLVALGPFGPI